MMCSAKFDPEYMSQHRSKNNWTASKILQSPIQGTKAVMMADAETVQKRCVQTFRLLTAICLLLLGLATHAVAQGGKRLILKDGSWQGITQYEVRGDRARFFSSQRGEWEELPKELVDWTATEKWNEGQEESFKQLSQFDAEEEAESKAETANLPAVAPGLKLPLTGGVYLLDTLSGRPSLDELTQDGSELNSDLRSALNRRASNRQQFELKRPHAHVQAHVPLPEIFVNIAIDEKPDEQPIALTERFRILRLESKTDSRVLARVEVSVLGKQNQSQQFVSTHTEGFHQGWLKIIPLGALEPGEYALVEMLGPNQFNSYVWDFGVNPNAPANPNPRKPASSANDKTSNVSPEAEPQRK